MHYTDNPMTYIGDAVNTLKMARIKATPISPRPGYTIHLLREMDLLVDYLSELTQHVGTLTAMCIDSAHRLEKVAVDEIDDDRLAEHLAEVGHTARQARLIIRHAELTFRAAREHSGAAVKRGRCFNRD